MPHAAVSTAERSRSSVETRTVADSAPAKSAAVPAAAPTVPIVRFTVGQAVSGDLSPQVSEPKFCHYTQATAILTFAFVFVSLVSARSARK